MSPDDILGFWYSERARPNWWKKSDAFDAQLRARFAATWEAACSGACDAWARTPEGALALVIVCDQLPRNMFRGEAEMYASDERALATAEGAIEAGFHELLPDDRLTFLFMPFMHAESREAQARSCELFLTPAVRGNHAYAVKHRDIVDRFGRFPHRNAILGRESTPEEVEFLEQPGSSF